MGRLIDADAFEKSVMFGDAEDMQDVIYALRDYPTVYDPVKVVEQLKDTKIPDRLARYVCTYNIALRYGMVQENREPIRFYFERCEKPEGV